MVHSDTCQPLNQPALSFRRSASTTTTTMPQGSTGRVGELHSQATAGPDASASAWLCHKGPIARLVSHIRAPNASPSPGYAIGLVAMTGKPHQDATPRLV
jgi:hypothetical protein